MSNRKEVVVLGCGLMGAALARTIADAGTPVGVWNRTFEKAKALENDRITPYASLDDALRSAETVIACVSNYEDLTTLIKGKNLSGLRLLNLTTGSPAEVPPLEELIIAAGARYLDGAILNYPQDVGTKRAAIVLSGNMQTWQTLAESIAPLGGLSYLGDDSRLANNLDGALVHLFHIPSLVAYVEAAAALLDAGVALEVLNGHTERMLGNFTTRCRLAAEALAREDYSTDQALLSTYARAARNQAREYEAEGIPAMMLRAAAQRLTDAENAGLGSRAIASLGRHVPKLEVTVPALDY